MVFPSRVAGGCSLACEGDRVLASRKQLRTAMSFGDLIQDAAAWVSEEIRKSIDDLSDDGPAGDRQERQWPAASAQHRQARYGRPVANVVSLDVLANWYGCAPVFLSYWRRPPPDWGMWRTAVCFVHSARRMLSCLVRYREESKLACGYFESPANRTPDGSTATTTPTNCRGADAGKLAEDPLPFRVNSDVNKRLYLFEGDICSLRTDCIMCFTTDGFSGSDELAGRLLARRKRFPPWPRQRKHSSAQLPVHFEH